MFDLESCLDAQLRKIEKPKPTLIFPEGEDGRVITAASHLLTCANVILVGRREQIEKQIHEGLELGVSSTRFLSRARLLEPEDPGLSPDVLEEMAVTLYQKSQGHRWEMSLDRARELMRDPIYLAILSVRFGYCDAVLGGLTHTSREFFLPCLRLLPKKGTVYEMALFALPDDHPEGVYQKNLMMLADVALNPEPSPKTLADIAMGSCKTMRDLIPTEVLPSVNGALLSYSTRGSGQGPSVMRVRNAGPLIEERLLKLRQTDPIYRSVSIDVELQASVALSEAAARTKLKEAHAQHPAAGRSNVLIVPSLDVGNVLYHIYSTRYPDARVVLVIGGIGSRALDFSRQSGPEQVVLGAKALILRRFKSPDYTRTPVDHFFPRYKVLTMNPGSTSTKLAFFEGQDRVARKEIVHDTAELEACGELMDQLGYRLEQVKRFQREEVGHEEFDAVVGRGGLILPVPGGTYAIDEKMLKHTAEGIGGVHPSNLGAWMAHELVKDSDKPAFVVDPPVVDELDETSRITGLRESEQEATWHALSQKAAAKLYAEKHGREYEDLNLIVAHLGGGISVGVHMDGRCVKVKNALYDGPMSPNRSGTLPGMDLIELCYSGISQKELKRKLIGNGGLKSYLGTDDLREVERRIEEGEDEASLVFEAMMEQIAAEIAACVPKFKGQEIHQILLTGGMARSPRLRHHLEKDLSTLGLGMTFYPGEREMEALRDGALRVLRGQEEAKVYEPLRSKL